MAYYRPITSDDGVFFDTDRLIDFRVWKAGSTAATIAAGTAIPEDVTGWAIGFTVRKTEGAATPLISKTTTAGSVTILGTYNADPLLNTQKVRVNIEDTDTYDPDADPAVYIKPADYFYALKRIDEGSETVLVYGEFTLLQSAAWE